MEEIVNEFGDNISEDDIIEITERILELSDDSIDELWFRCEFIMPDHEKDGLKALRKKDIENIRDGSTTEEMISDLLTEAPLKKVTKHLEELE